MPAAALALTLAAAVTHAAWNLLLSGAEDPRSTTAVAVVFGTIVFAPVAALDWHLSSGAGAFVAASSALELLYLLLLAAAYSAAAMSFVYPIARGSAPVLVLVLDVVLLHSAPRPLAIAGVVTVAAGIVMVRGIGGESRPRDLALALGVGACIAGYTLVDKHGLAHASPLAYLEVIFAITAAGYVALAWRTAGLAALRQAVSPRALLAGVGFFGAYGLTLAALRLASAPSVAAVRESSVVIAVAALRLGGRETIGTARAAGALLVVAGVAIVAAA
jgi:drug/metabolite transporter (DMT)-like permease